MNLQVTRILCALLLFCCRVVCQVDTASLTGLVRDPTSAVAPDAKVTARNSATGPERTGETNSAGYYVVANLPVGSYEISVEKNGFHKSVSALELDATEKGLQDFTLAVGATSTIATVEASAAFLSTEDSSVGRWSTISM